MTEAPQDRWQTVNGLKVHYRDWGGSGQPVVLLHGLASNCRFWDLVAPILSEHFAVVALEQRGHGESDKPDHGYDFATVCSDLRDFVQALGLEKPVVVGHSWGADVALRYAVEYPGSVKGACLVDGGIIDISARPGGTLELARKEMAPPDFTGTTVEQLAERAPRHLGPWATPLILEKLFANFEILDDNTVRARLSRQNHMRIIEAMWEHRPSALYPRVRCPVLLMPTRGRETHSPVARWFDKDEAVAAAARLLPVSETVWMEDSVHDVPLQRPDLVARVLEERIRSEFFG